MMPFDTLSHISPCECALNYSNNPNGVLVNQMNHARAKAVNRFHSNYSGGSLSDPFFTLCDVDIFTGRRCFSRCALAQTGFGPIVCQLCSRVAARLSLYQSCSASVLPGCRGLAGPADLPLPRQRSFLDSLCPDAVG